MRQPGSKGSIEACAEQRQTMETSDAEAGIGWEITKLRKAFTSRFALTIWNLAVSIPNQSMATVDVPGCDYCIPYRHDMTRHLNGVLRHLLSGKVCRSYRRGLCVARSIRKGTCQSLRWWSESTSTDLHASFLFSSCKFQHIKACTWRSRGIV